MTKQLTGSRKQIHSINMQSKYDDESFINKSFVPHPILWIHRCGAALNGNQNHSNF